RAEFCRKGELEEPTVLARRLMWDAGQSISGCSFHYALTLVKVRGELAAVRDHTTIVCDGVDRAVVHLSHSFVAQEWRRTGLAGWLRALPIQAARFCFAERGRALNSPITLVGEMNPLDANDPLSFARLKAYGKAGFLLIDPGKVSYLQPDFRAPDEIDSSGGPKPLLLTLIVRRVGREKQTAIKGGEILDIVESLYRMYGATFHRSHMEAVRVSLNRYPAADEVVNLLPPTTDLTTT
ncbi:MAG TPA: hypothetical protein VIT23_06805, partial [Terrimicrobiaceae bacterium]